jgi:LmbE family N-acetylglucosaminyl deacetylase
MNVLYVFSHPDDASFGPARVMSWQRRQGHEAYLLTLTRGGASRQRFKDGSLVAEMRAARYREMLDAARVLDLPDSGRSRRPDPTSS